MTRAPGSSTANGPTTASSPISAWVATVSLTLQRSPTQVSLSRAEGPISLPAPTVVTPRRIVPGNSVTSAASVTVTST